jgi:hypothetical protein
VGVDKKEGNVVGQRYSLISVANRVLGPCVVEDKENSQRQKIFYLRCLINQRPCSMLIDGGNCTNVISTTLVENLGLQTTKHPKPYKLQ